MNSFGLLQFDVVAVFYTNRTAGIFYSGDITTSVAFVISVILWLSCVDSKTEFHGASFLLKF